MTWDIGFLFWQLEVALENWHSALDLESATKPTAASTDFYKQKKKTKKTTTWWSLEVQHICQHSLVPVAVAVATGCAMSGGGFNFISSPRLLVFRLLVLRRSFNLIWSLLGVTTVGEDAELRCAVELVCTTLVTVMVCLEAVPADGLVTTMVPSDGNWFSWFKTKVVVEGWGFSCKDTEYD